MNITRESGNWDLLSAVMTHAQCIKTDRYHVDSLLNISEESFAEWYLCRVPAQSAWEQVVKGWNECPPLACLFELQNKYKRVKTGEHEFHCLLCIDASLSPKPDEDDCVNSESSLTLCSLPEEHEGENRLCPTIHPETPGTSPSVYSSSDSERGSFMYEKKPTIQAESGKVIRWAALPDALPKLTDMKFTMQCPLIRGKGILNKFSVLPPVRSSGHPKASRLRRLEASSLSSSGSLTAENVSHSLPLPGKGRAAEEKIRPRINSGSGGLEDSHRSFTAECYESSKQLLSIFSIRLSKRSSLNSFDMAADLAVRKLKNNSLVRAGHHQKRTENKLPRISGTRIPMHRIVFTSHA